MKDNKHLLAFRSIGLIRVYFPVLVGLMVGISGCATRYHKDIEQAIWQQDQNPSVELGVRDKLDSHVPFDATFEVTSPDGVIHVTHANIEGSDFTDVNFPYDFDDGDGYDMTIEGQYSWRCLVESNTVASGAFEYHRAGTQEEVRTLYY
jgi:hypothetical protein